MSITRVFMTMTWVIKDRRKRNRQLISNYDYTVYNFNYKMQTFFFISDLACQHMLILLIDIIKTKLFLVNWTKYMISYHRSSTHFHTSTWSFVKNKCTTSCINYMIWTKQTFVYILLWPDANVTYFVVFLT
jgi:hypothetical protein